MCHLRRLALLCSLALLLPACRDESPAPVAAAVRLSSFFDTVFVGQRIAVSAFCVDGNERRIPHPVQWFSATPALAEVRAAGNEATIIGMHPGEAYVWILCEREPMSLWSVSSSMPTYFAPTWAQRRVIVREDNASTWSVDGGDATLILRAPTPDDSVSGTSQLLTARGRFASGTVAAPDQFRWTTFVPQVATVSPDGLVTARRVGSGSVVVSWGLDSRVVPVEVRDLPATPRWDVALVDAHWTQSSQDERQSIPMLRGARPAVVNVLAFATPGAPPRSVILRVMDVAGSLIWQDTTALQPDTARAPSFARPNGQFIVPVHVIDVASRWQLVIDQDSTSEDIAPHNDRLPRTGTEALRTVTPPVLKLHLVPIRLRAHGGVTTTITPAEFDNYVYHTRIRLPVGRIETTVGEPLESDANFVNEGFATVGGDSPFFQRVLTEVDAARVADPANADRIWIGVIPHVEGTTSRWGGMAYLPSHPGDMGPMSRTQVVRGHDNYPSAPIASAATVAHELGHNFGRRHAPCGGAGGPDPYYPVPGGFAGKWGMITDYLVNGDSAWVGSVPEDYGDMMGYCRPRWISPYTYLGILRFREMQGPTLRADEPRMPILIVRGQWGTTSLTLTMVQSGQGAPSRGEVTAPVLVELLGANDEVLLRVPALMGSTSDDESRSFAAHLPLSPAHRAALRAVRVRAGAQSVRREFTP